MRKIRPVVLALLLLILAAGAVQARTRSLAGEPAGFLEDVWLRFAARVAALWEKEGSMMDPNGKPSEATTPPPGEAGGMMDPNG